MVSVLLPQKKKTDTNILKNSSMGAQNGPLFHLHMERHSSYYICRLRSPMLVHISIEI